jgi:hypothetical protein
MTAVVLQKDKDQPEGGASSAGSSPGPLRRASDTNTWAVHRREELLHVLSEDLKVTLQNHFAFQAQLGMFSKSMIILVAITVAGQRAYFGYSVSNEIRRIVATGRSAAIFGFAMMLIALILSRLVLSIPGETDESEILHWQSVLSNALEIFSWVVWWKRRSFEIALILIFPLTDIDTRLRLYQLWK